MQNSQIVQKPWGHEEIWAHTEKYVGKLLVINAGERLSFQYHEKKDETIRIMEGEMLFTVEVNEVLQEITMKPGDSFHIQTGVKHRMSAVTNCVVLEVSTPELDDVIRLEDDYDRNA